MINLSPHSCQAVFEVASAHGRRRFELWHADITTLPFPVDLLVVSAFSRDYTPTSSSVIGALHRTGISVSELAVSPAYDFRGSPLQCWVSGILSGPLMPAPDPAPGEVAEVPRYGRILCLEMVPSDRLRGLGQLFSGIFGVQSMLESQLEQVAPVRVMALPALGAGDQSFPVSMVVDALVGAATAALEGARYLERIVWVSKSRSDVDAFRVALEARLGRVRVPMRTDGQRRSVSDRVLPHNWGLPGLPHKYVTQERWFVEGGRRGGRGQAPLL